MSKPNKRFFEQIVSSIDNDLHLQLKPESVSYFSNQTNALKQFKDIETVRQRATAKRWKVVENLDKYLIEFEANFLKAGGKAIWARDSAEAQKEIINILRKSFSKEVYFEGKSICTEIKLNDALAGDDFKVVPIDSNNDNLSTVIIEVNYFIADTGAVVLIDYCGKVQQALSKAKSVIAITSITDVLPNLIDLNLFIPLTSSYTQGAQINRTTSILFGSRKADEGEGVKEFNLLILDNGRSNLLADESIRQSLWCINCNACKNACPVSTTIRKTEGAYENPLNALQLPYIKDFEEYRHLSDATTLCGSCTQSCPVNINLHELFLHNRKRIIALQLNSQKEKWFYLAWKKTMLMRDKFSFGSFKSNKIVMETVYEKIWGTKNSLPHFAKKTFNEMWKER